MLIWVALAGHYRYAEDAAPPDTDELYALRPSDDFRAIFLR